MGWCSGTVIFDKVMDLLLSKKKIDKHELIVELIDVLEDGDWDCQSDSEYYSHPIVRAAFEEVHPDWFEDESIELEDVVVVMSGFRDPHLQVSILDAGGRVTNSVTSKTTHLLISGKTMSDGSSKMEKAEKLGIAIMTPDEFKADYNLK